MAEQHYCGRNDTSLPSRIYFSSKNIKHFVNDIFTRVAGSSS